jgi:hypothetical protein
LEEKSKNDILHKHLKNGKQFGRGKVVKEPIDLLEKQFVDCLT